VTAGDLARMKPSSLFHNTSRARLLEPDALVRTLETGRRRNSAILPTLLAVDLLTYHCGSLFFKCLFHILCTALYRLKHYFPLLHAPLNGSDAPASRRNQWSIHATGFMAVDWATSVLARRSKAEKILLTPVTLFLTFSITREDVVCHRFDPEEGCHES
jgi:hypothetical protein